MLLLRLVLSMFFAFVAADSLTVRSVRAQGTAVQIPGLPGTTPESLPGKLYRPSGAGPFPGIVVLHTCGGIDGNLQDWGSRFADWGYVAILPDSFSPRGINKVCNNGKVTAGDRVPDVHAAAAYLRTLPFVRADRIGAIGYSHGGGTSVLTALRPPQGPALQAAVAFYPACPPNAVTPRIPTLVLIGDKDDWTPAPQCEIWRDRVANADRLSVVVYPGVYHAFDQRTAAGQAFGAGGVAHKLEYNGGATADATSKTQAFFAKWLKN